MSYAAGESTLVGSANSPPQCQHMVTRKKRLCRMTVRPGRRYCGEHDCHDPVEPSAPGPPQKMDSRIPCPLDPKHTCYASKLEKHLLVCNARCESQPAYINKGCNIIGGGELSEKVEGRLRLKDVSAEKLQAVIGLVERLFTEVVQCSLMSQIECEQAPVHQAVLEDYQLEERGRNTRRHLRQTSSLLRCLEREGLVRPDTCYVELGAGKGHVSYYLSRAVQDVPSSSVVLVDRASHRHKQDNKLDRSRYRVSRVRADIGDLVLAELADVRAAAALVAVSKHLCGAATDYALRCAAAESVRGKCRGVVMATCCHHRCSSAAYVARPFLEENGITPEYFEILLGVVSWATCGTGYSRERRGREEQETARKRQKTQHDRLAEGYAGAGDTCGAGQVLPERGVLIDDSDNGNIEAGDYDSPEGKKLPEKTVDGRSTISHEHLLFNNDKQKFEVTSEIENSVKVFNQGNIIDVGFTDGKANVESKVTDVDSLKKSNIGVTDKLDLGNGNIEVTDVRLGLTVERRTEIGRRAKALLDYGRVVYLKDCGFDAKLCYFVDVNVSPENVCIVAKK